MPGLPGMGQVENGSILQPPQPSPGTVLPSSHSSAPLSTPSPQKATRLHGMPAMGHIQPSSTPQAAEQPSLAVLLPSSHCSPALTAPSPQRAVTTFVQGWPGVVQA